ncbi:FAD-binding oxidoreductase, partial [Actinoplanes sp. NPDC051633]|uniref:FAD-binding oxidoreductase n=1 Tax=Actinoplanes sp. NPDC051633 TaxID=3155670 RepID=UPI0034392C84
MGALDELTRPAGDDDVVCGVPARLVAAPASTAEASALLADARGLSVVVRGAGTKIDWGTPPRTLDLIIDTHRMAGVREHAAGDLITVLGAGTRLDDLDLPGQELALDTPLPGATIGGTVAANISGPRRTLYGTARDLLIGIEVVRADGTVARAGGKVVKNVAGYDLGKLFTGSYGTLGLITECAFRLHPLPAATAVITATASAPDGAGRLVAAVLGAQVVPSAIEVNAPPTGDIEVAVLVEGTPAGVRDRADMLAKLLGPTAAAGVPAWWGA